MATYITYNETERPLHILNFVLIDNFETDVIQHLRSYQGFQNTDIIQNRIFIAFSNNAEDVNAGIKLHSSDQVPAGNESFLRRVTNINNIIKTITSTRGEECNVVWNFNNFTRFTDAQIRDGGGAQQKVLNNYVIFLRDFKYLFRDINNDFGVGIDANFENFMGTLRCSTEGNIGDDDSREPFFICNFFKNIKTKDVDITTNVNNNKQQFYRTFIQNARNISTNIEGIKFRSVVDRTVTTIKNIVNLKKNGNVTDRVRGLPGRNIIFSNSDYGYLQHKLGNTSTNELETRINRLTQDNRYYNYTVMDKIIAKILCITFTSGINPIDGGLSACAIVDAVQNTANNAALAIAPFTARQIVEGSTFDHLNQELFIFNKNRHEITFNGNVTIQVISTGNGTNHNLGDGGGDVLGNTLVLPAILDMVATGTCNYRRIKINADPDNATSIQFPEGVVLFNGNPTVMDITNQGGPIKSFVIPYFQMKVNDNSDIRVPDGHFLFLKQEATINLPANDNNPANLYLEVILPPNNDANNILPFTNESGHEIPAVQIVPTDGGAAQPAIADNGQSGGVRRFRYENNAASGNIRFPARTIFIGCNVAAKSTITFVTECRVAFGTVAQIGGLMAINNRNPGNWVTLRNAYPRIPL